MRPDHTPIGDPCALCQMSAVRHRVEHDLVGTDTNHCEKCGLPLSCHRMRFRQDTRKRPSHWQRPRPYESMYVGLDGEGQGRERHKYVMLCASNELGDREWVVENPNGLSTEECLQFLVSLPANARAFTFAFHYDLTKILADLDDETLWMLNRPELRQRHGPEAYKGPWPVWWKGWQLNLQGSKFGVAKGRTKKRIVWDIFKFYQTKFVSALTDWKVGDEEEWNLLQGMKDRRHEFDKLTREQVIQYCFLECRRMAGLAHKLVDAQEAAGLPLKSFYGAGSSASVMLDKMGVKAYLKKPPEEMNRAVAQGFFGGRFDNSVVGTFRQRVYSYDISSAYPYQLVQLPCLIHGEWRKTNRRADIEKCTAALVHYGLSEWARGDRPWGPFPFREDTGNICFPLSSGGGWVWQKEYLAGERIFPNVFFKEAWVYETTCDCRPFNKISHYYNERCRIGKEGPGIVLKLGCNSCYGKIAQSVGKGQFNNWAFAGMITSGCRAQVLDALSLHDDWSNMLMVATDGIASLEPLALPQPIETGTNVEFWDPDQGRMIRKPLGGWEEKKLDNGMFIARPGVYFPLDLIDRKLDEKEVKKILKQVRGRGVGRTVMFENGQAVVDAWENWDGRGEWPKVKVANVSRFCGMKSSIHRSGKPGAYVYTRAAGDHLHSTEPKPRYGEWIVRRVEVSFHPLPKRAGIAHDKRSLIVRRLPQDIESTPYDRADLSDETLTLRKQAQELLEQPDGDYSLYEEP